LAVVSVVRLAFLFQRSHPAATLTAAASNNYRRSASEVW
jgi:hypothetical protein